MSQIGLYKTVQNNQVYIERSCLKTTTEKKETPNQPTKQTKYKFVDAENSYPSLHTSLSEPSPQALFLVWSQICVLNSSDGI